MMRRLALLLAAAWALSACGPTQQINFVDMDSGQNRSTSAPFNPTGTWDMTYSWDCKRQHSEGIKDLDRLSLTVYNSDDDSTAFETPEVSVKGSSGKSTVHYKRSGWYYITIDSPCDWRLQAVDTSKA
jgi:hypothetical protein